MGLECDCQNEDSNLSCLSQNYNYLLIQQTQLNSAEMIFGEIRLEFQERAKLGIQLINKQTKNECDKIPFRRPQNETIRVEWTYSTDVRG